MSNITAIIANGGNASPAAQLAIAKGSLLTAMNLPKITAPATISIIIDVVRTVSLKAFLKFFQLSRRLKTVMMSILAAPTEPASVGVKYPQKASQGDHER